MLANRTRSLVAVAGAAALVCTAAVACGESTAPPLPITLQLSNEFSSGWTITIVDTLSGSASAYTVGAADTACYPIPATDRGHWVRADSGGGGYYFLGEFRPIDHLGWEARFYYYQGQPSVEFRPAARC